MKQIITKEELGKVIGDLVSQGKKPTLNAVHAALNQFLRVFDFVMGGGMPELKGKETRFMILFIVR